MPTGYWHLEVLWFALIAILWIGYFVLEGFDFGVGTLLPFLAEDDTDQRVMINTIGPVWDGNEVWLLTAGGATFAAFPGWYATLFSGFYLALFLILVALIVRGVAFEYRGKRDSARWRAWWDRAIFFGSALPALLWGVAFANMLQGVPIDARGEYTGTLLTLLNPYALVGGLMTLAVFTLHGAVYLSLKTKDEMLERARAGGSAALGRDCRPRLRVPVLDLPERRIRPRQGPRPRRHPAHGTRPGDCGAVPRSSRPGRPGLHGDGSRRSRS